MNTRSAVSSMALPTRLLQSLVPENQLRRHGSGTYGHQLRVVILRHQTCRFIRYGKYKL